MATKYMHTLDGRPASFCESYGGYIHFVGGRNSVKLVDNLRTIRKQQKHDKERRAIERPYTPASKYDYVLVAVPDAAQQGE